VDGTLLNFSRKEVKTMLYEKPTIVTLTVAELENATMNAMLDFDPMADGGGDCGCQCQCQCQCQKQ
jgi:hypothetical protein